MDLQELSMNVLDIAENSIRAKAGLVEIVVEQDTAANRETLVIRDDGKGMDAEMVARVTDPFCTTRTTRKVGLGLPFLKMAAEMAGGGLLIDSVPGKGTTVQATFQLDSIDLMPLGDMGSTIAALVQTNPDTEFAYTFRKDGKEFVFTTQEVRAILGDVPLSEPAVALFIRDYITEHMDIVRK